MSGLQQQQILKSSGQGILQDVWSGVKKFGSKLNQGLKDTKLVSKTLHSLGNPYYLGSVAQHYGYGPNITVIKNKKKKKTKK